MSSVMSSESDFKSRYAAVLDVTLRNALSETRTLYETMVEELQEEMCSVKTENEALRSKYDRLKKQRRSDTASQCDFLHQVPAEKTTESTLTLVALKSKDDDEDRDSSNSSETDSVDSDESEESSEEDLNTFKPQKSQNVKGRLSLRKKRPKNLEASNQTPITRGPRVCTICKKRCHNAAGLKLHMRIHLLEKAYVCTVCGKGWYQKGSLTKHMREKHTGSISDIVDRPFSCSICLTSFKLSGHLKTHMSIHTFVKGIICTVCGKKYKNKSGLEVHMRRIHTEEKPFSCTDCGKGFDQSEHLTTHMIIHTGENPCVCTVCDRSFSQSIGLNRHMIVHTGKKCFSCVICSKRFYQSTEMKEHMVIHTSTHTDEKPCSNVDTYDHSYAMAFPC